MKLAADVRSSNSTPLPSTNGQTQVGNPVSGYLYAKNTQRSRISQESGPEEYLEAFEHLARRLIFRAFDQLKQLRQRGRTPEEAWNETGVELSRVGFYIYKFRTYSNQFLL
jgi:hypothetical protein